MNGNTGRDKVKLLKNAAILAAGEGSRLAENTPFKPFTNINGSPLILRLVSLVKSHGISEILCLVNANCQKAPTRWLDQLRDSVTRCRFLNTPSSLHTLWHAFNEFQNETHSTHLLVSMVDTIIPVPQFSRFIEFCASLRPSESAILTTGFIDDEKPLFVHTDENNIVTHFGAEDPHSKNLITSGMYCFSWNVRSVLQTCIDNKILRMRNFLSHLAQSEHTIKAFTVPKTVDVDRPEDIAVAERFLEGR